MERAANLLAQFPTRKADLMLPSLLEASYWLPVT